MLSNRTREILRPIDEEGEKEEDERDEEECKNEDEQVNSDDDILESIIGKNDWYRDNLECKFTKEETSWMKKRNWTKTEYGTWGCSFGRDDNHYCLGEEESIDYICNKNK